jgi:hypothetical protein
MANRTIQKLLSHDTVTDQIHPSDRIRGTKGRLCLCKTITLRASLIFEIVYELHPLFRHRSAYGTHAAALYAF